MKQKAIRLCLGVAGVISIGALAWAGGGDPWNSKPYQQWTEKDLQKIQSDSPWVRTVSVEQTWKKLSKEELGQTPSDSRLGPGGSTILPAEHDDSVALRGRNVQFAVFWSSSHTLRAAMARGGVLHDNKDPKEADRYASAPQEEYQLLVRGPDMSPFESSNEKSYMDLAWLTVKPSKGKVAPTQVKFVIDPKYPKVVDAAIFYFPKKTANGAPTIPDNTKSIDFACKVGDSTIHADFAPRKMQDMAGTDL